ALHSISLLLPTVAVSHSDVPPCSVPQRGYIGGLELRSHCGAAIRTPRHCPKAISAANSANATLQQSALPQPPREEPQRARGPNDSFTDGVLVGAKGFEPSTPSLPD